MTRYTHPITRVIGEEDPVSTTTTTMTIRLRNDLRKYVEREVASGRFANAEEVIEAALESQSEMPDLVIQPTMTVQEAVAEALAQVEHGEYRELTAEVWAEIDREADEAIHRGDPVRDEVKY